MIIMYVDGKGTVFSMKLKLEEESFEKRYQKNNFEKDVMDLIKANHQINIISENSSVSGNTLFKKDLNAKSLAMLWESCSSCAKYNAAASVSFARVIWTYMCDVNSALRRNSKEPSLLLMSAETSFDDDDSNKGALSVNKTCQ